MKIKTLYQAHTAVSMLTPELERLYDGGLGFPVARGNRPYVIGNFVETLDGIVSYRISGKSGGGPVSGNSAEDRFTMGLLRAVSDAVLCGSGTLHDDPGHIRTPEFVYPGAKDFYAELRRKSRKTPLPLNVVLTASGKLDLSEPTFHMEGLTVIVITTEEGAARLRSNDSLDQRIIVRSTGEAHITTPGAVLEILSEEFGVKLLLHEGGPRVFGQFLAAKAVDEFFVTVSPQVAGRQHAVPRPGFAGETAFSPETAPLLKLEAIKRGGDHLLLRYAL